MSPKILGHLVDGGIPFLAGVYCTLRGFGVIEKETASNPEIGAKNKWMKWGGPFLMIFGLFQMLRGFIE
jgi:hypothetical protein